MAGMTAIVLHDLGSRRESRAWFATAARAAAESGDDQLHAWVLAREAMVPLNYGAPKAAAGLAERARHVAGHRPTAAATLAAAVAARAYALNHQSEQARAVVGWPVVASLGGQGPTLRAPGPGRRGQRKRRAEALMR